MEALKLVDNENVEEIAEEINHVGVGRGFKIAAGVGLVVVAGFVTYKYVIKPTIERIKSEKTPEYVIVTDDDDDSEHADDCSEKAE